MPLLRNQIWPCCSSKVSRIRNQRSFGREVCIGSVGITQQKHYEAKINYSHKT